MPPPRTPRALILWMINEVERAFSQKNNPGDLTVKKTCQDLKAWIEKEWTDQKETEILEREKLRWEKARAEAIVILGNQKWTELTKSGDEMKDHLVMAFLRFEDEFFKFEETNEWKTLVGRLRDAAATGAGKKNIQDMSKDIQEKAKKFLDSNILEEALDKNNVVRDLLSGKSTMGIVAEQIALELSKQLGVITDEKDEDKIEALGALVRFRNGGVKNPTPGLLLSKVADSAPIALKEIKNFEDSICKTPGARKYLEIFVEKADELLSQERLNLILNGLSEISSTGEGAETANKLSKAISDNDFRTAKRVLKSYILNWILRLLPQLDLPPIDGTRDGVSYSVKGMEISHIHVDERNVRLIFKTGLGQIKRGDPVVKVVLDDVSANIKDMQFTFKQEYFPFISGQGVAHANVTGVCVILGFQFVKRDRKKIHSILAKLSGETVEENEASSTAGSTGKDDFVPQLVLGVCRVTIDQVKVTFGDASWYSVVADVFAASIRTYICSMVEDMIVEKVTQHLEKSNEGFAVHGWDLLTSAFEIDAFALPTEDEAAKRAEHLDGSVSERKDVYSVRFVKDGPIGLALGKWNEFVVVKSFKKAKDGSILPAEASGKIKVGDILVGFNGGEITSLPLDRVTTRISRSRRPLTLSFVEGDAKSMEASQKRNHVVKFIFKEEKLFLLIKARATEDLAAVVLGFRSPGTGQEGPAEKAGVPINWILAGINGANMLDKTFKETMNIFAATTQRPIELKFVRDPDFEISVNEAPVDLKLSSYENVVIIAGFSQMKSPAELMLGDTIQSGDFVAGVGPKDTSGMKFDDTISLIRSTPRPVEIRFGRIGSSGITAAALFPVGSLGMVFYKSSIDGRCCFKSFQGIEGPVERLKEVRPGNVIKEIGGIQVTSEQQARELLLQTNFPLKIRFRDMEAYEAGGWKQ